VDYDSSEKMRIERTYAAGPILSATPANMNKLVIFEKVGQSLGGHVMWQTPDGTWSSKNGAQSRWNGITNIRGFYKRHFPKTSELSASPKFFLVPK
jgi:hypothetical protein